METSKRIVCLSGAFQCDQMALLYLQYLLIFNNENVPNSIE